MLADASDAIIIGFNVRPQPKAKTLAEQEKVDVRLYRVIYQAIEDINAARVGMLAPTYVEEDTARVEVRELFKVPKIGVIAGCYVPRARSPRRPGSRGTRRHRRPKARWLNSWFKRRVKSVKQGYECGIGIAGSRPQGGRHHRRLQGDRGRPRVIGSS
jgi:translation initiation factor IF-2